MSQPRLDPVKMVYKRIDYGFGWRNEHTSWTEDEDCMCEECKRSEEHLDEDTSTAHQMAKLVCSEPPKDKNMAAKANEVSNTMVDIICRSVEYS